MPILRKYATATTINFPLIGLGTVNFTSTASLTTADLKLSLNEGAFATVGTAIVNEGSFGYSYTCTTADLTAARIMMVIISTAATKECEDTMILIETYGHANAQHAFDLGTASVTVSAGTITSVTNSVTATVGTNNDKTGYSLTQSFPANFADLTITATTGLVSISTASLVVAGTVSDKTGYALTQTFPSNFADLSITATTGGVKLQANQSVIASAGTVTVSAGTITSITGVTFPTNFGDLSISATTGLVAISTASSVVAGTVGDKTGYSLSQTFPSNFADLSISATTGGVKIATGGLASGGFAAGAINATVIADGAIDAATFAAGAIDATAIATNAIDADALAADAVTEIWAKAMVAPTGVPAPTASVLSSISWLYGLSAFKITQTSVLQTVFQSDGSTTLAASTVSDDGSVFSKNAFT